MLQLVPESQSRTEPGCDVVVIHWPVVPHTCPYSHWKLQFAGEMGLLLVGVNDWFSSAKERKVEVNINAEQSAAKVRSLRIGGSPRLQLAESCRRRIIRTTAGSRLYSSPGILRVSPSPTRMARSRKAIWR